MASINFSTGHLRLELSPSVGGSISAFEWTGEGEPTPILRKCEVPPEKPLDAACCPLVPFANRIRRGRFNFRDREVRLMPNLPGDPSPMHGQGWLNPWTIEEAEDVRAVLSFRRHAGEWPWDYEARQSFDLDERGLLVSLSCRNTSDQPMPCGLGQHPYFPCGPETRIDTKVTNSWTIDDQVLPVDEVPAEGRYDLKDRLICGQDLDNGFGGWGGGARIGDPGWPFDIRLSSPTAKFFQIYSPPGHGYFAAEPVTHANAALNAPEEEWPELGLRVLEPGEEMSLEMRLDVVPK